MTEITRSFEGKLRVTFQVDAVDELRGMAETELEIGVKPYKEKRSLDANAYFHVLVGKLADKLHMSKPRMKNMLLGRYGQREYFGGKPLIITVISSVDMYEREDVHCLPVGYATVQDKEFTHWAVVRGSHTYNSAEMSYLIDGTVQEAKDCGIETMSPAELERMKNAWLNRYYKKSENASSAAQQSDSTNTTLSTERQIESNPKSTV